jgi:hypothetical protein
MAEQFFRFSLVTVSLGFMAYFGVVVVPPLLESGDVIGAFAAGFVNPYSSGYSADVVACWLVRGRTPPRSATSATVLWMWQW